MIVTLHTQGLQALAQARAVVSGNEPISFTLADRHATYGWMADTLRLFGYTEQYWVRSRFVSCGVVRYHFRWQNAASVHLI